MPLNTPPRYARSQTLRATGAIALAAGLAAPATPAAFAQPVDEPADHVAWADQIGSPANDEAFAASDHSRANITGAGLTTGSLGGASGGMSDIFIFSYYAPSLFFPSIQAGTGQNDSAHAAVSTSLDDVIVGGGTAGSFGGPSAGSFDAFVLRANPDTGAQPWRLQFGSPGIETVNGLTPDGQGGVWGTGITNGPLAGPAAGGFDSFAFHADENGNLDLLEQFGTSADDEPHAAAFDGTNLVIAGSTRGALGGPNLGGADAFIVGMDEQTGQLIWSDQFGTAQDDRITGLFPDPAGGVFFTGVTHGSLAAPNKGSADIIVGHYDSTGANTWTSQLGSSGFDETWAIGPCGNGDFVIGGTTSGALAGTNKGGLDAFIIRFNDQGVPKIIHQIGTNRDDVIYGLTADEEGHTTVTGTTWGSLGGPNAGGSDIFVVEFDDSCTADCDTTTGAGNLDIFDFLCFQGDFVQGGVYACNCDTSTGAMNCDIFDFLCFQNAFVSGCP